MNAHPLKTAERAAHDAFQKAMLARDAVERCSSPEWLAAHKVAGEKAREWKTAQEAVFTAAKNAGSAHKAHAAGLEFAPYWWGPIGGY